MSKKNIKSTSKLARVWPVAISSDVWPECAVVKDQFGRLQMKTAQRHSYL